MEYSTKYWIVVVVLALVLLVGTGALSVWICKLYDTEKAPSLPPSVSPFPDVVPNVLPPPTDPTINTCYKWCSDGKPCPEVTPVTCSTDEDCGNKCTPPNSVTGPAKCDLSALVCVPPYQTCISGFPTYPGTDTQGQSVQAADPSNLKPCITNTDCNLCTDKLQEGQTMNCVFVPADSNLTLCDGACQVQGIPEGNYCLPERTGCNSKAGTATWSAQGWTCECLWNNEIMSGPECNTLVACNNNLASADTQNLQQLLVNCNDASNPLCGQPWVPESKIDPTGCYDSTKGFGNPIQCGVTNAAPNCVCQCDGVDKNTNKGFTYDPNNPLTCVPDPCNNGAWGRTLLGDASYALNSMTGVIYTFQVVSPVTGTFQLNASSALNIVTATTPENKFMMPNEVMESFNSLGQLVSYFVLPSLGNSWGNVGTLTTNEDGSKIGTADYVFGASAANSVNSDSQMWVLQPQPGYLQRPDNLDNLVLSNPSWNRPAGANFSSPVYNNNRYLLYNTATKTFSLGPLTSNLANVSVVVVQRIQGVNAFDNTEYIAQPFTNCACSGANSVSSVKACFDSNDNFVGISSLMTDTSMCDETYSRNISALCDPYVIPNSVVTVKPPSNNQTLCSLFSKDLKAFTTANKLLPLGYPSSTNLFSNKTGLVPGLSKFVDFNGVETIQSVCTADPCTGAYGDPSYSLQNSSGFWNAARGQCGCQNGNLDNPSANYYPFSVDKLNSTWNQTCKNAASTSSNTSSACVCNHITNPLCAVCQNACQGSNFCKSDPRSPCASANISCETDPDTGGPSCVCSGNCIPVPTTTGGGTKSNLCMAKIAPNGICTGLEGYSVCQTDTDVCERVAKGYSTTSQVISPSGAVENLPVCENVNTGTVSFCTDPSITTCWDSKNPNDDGKGACSSNPTCPIPANSS